jgi:hypothetical protein
MYSLCAQFSTAAEGCDATDVDLKSCCRQPNKKAPLVGGAFNFIKLLTL